MPSKIMKDTKPLFEVYQKLKGKRKGAIIIHMSSKGISRFDLIAILESLKYQQIVGKGKWENTSKQNKTWKTRKIK